MDHKDFFAKFGRNVFGECDIDFSIEDLYQAIKARLMDEVAARQWLGMDATDPNHEPKPYYKWLPLRNMDGT